MCTRYIYQLRDEKAETRRSRIIRNRNAYEKAYKRRSDNVVFSMQKTGPASRRESRVKLTDAMSSPGMEMESRFEIGHDRNDSDASTAGLLEHADHSEPMSYEEEGFYSPYADASPNPRQ